MRSNIGGYVKHVIKMINFGSKSRKVINVIDPKT